MGICDSKMIQFVHANHSNTNLVIAILIHFAKKCFHKVNFRYFAMSHA